MVRLCTDMEEALGDDVNEADTRYRIINRLISNVLGWPAQHVHAEEKSEDGFMDYRVGAPGAQFVLEAKRTGVDFALPHASGAELRPLAALVTGKNGKPLRDALKQASRYAQDNGIPIAVVFNGHQLLIFLANRHDGIPPLEGTALVFQSPGAFVADFVKLWNALTPSGLESRALFSTLQLASPVPPDPLSHRLIDYPGIQRRNQLQTGLQILSDLFLGNLDDLEDIRGEFLRDCYASSGALSQYAEVSKQILTSRYELLNDLGSASVESAQDKRGLNKEFTHDVLQAALSSRPIILLGDVGAGKSTFIERLIHVDAKEVLGESVSIYVDFGAASTLASLQTHVIHACEEQLLSKYETDIRSMTFAENALRAELKRFDNSPAGALRDIDPAEYAKARVQYLLAQMDDMSTYLPKALEWMKRSWRRQIVIFLDNVDQRSTDDQNQVFLISNELAAVWPATVFVTLRPETFYTSEREGAISGYHPRVFTISPPRAEVMLERRVKFALTQLRSSGRMDSFPSGISVDSDSLETFLEILQHNFGRNEPLIRLVDNLAGGNMRTALKFTTDFMGSGHINTAKMIERQNQAGTYNIPVHEFIRSIMYGDTRFYDPNSSPVANLFRLTGINGTEHFLVPLLLAFVQRTGDSDTQYGYVAAGAIYRSMQELGFEAAEISLALSFCARFNLLDSTRRYGRMDEAEVFRATTVGAYSYKSLIFGFVYFDAIATDIQILDPEVRGRVNDTHSVRDRLDRVESLIDYLDSQWAKVPLQNIWDWRTASKAVQVDLDRIRSFN